jgi:predicted dienelactone hydrolase
MRPLEFVIPLLLAIYLLVPPPRPFIIRILPAGALLLTLIHFVIEGYRWQMLPVYALTLILTAIAFFLVDGKPLASYLTLGLLAVSTAIPILLPVPTIPTPSGPYRVGTRIYELTDSSRKEIYSGKDEARRFMIQVWYPSEISPSDERAPWMANAKVFAPAIATQIDMPSFFLDHLALVRIPAYKESKVALSDRGYPVILFSHGWNGFNAQNTSQALELASHGYIVIGIQHTYGAVITVFPDGTVAENNPSALPDGAPTEEYETAAHILSDQWASDMGFTLDFMELQNSDPNSPFYGLLDLNLVGVYGHSTGGGAAIQFCGTDTRCKSLLGMDPFMRPVSYEVIDGGVPQPSFFMFSQRWKDDVDSRNNVLFQRFYPNVKEPFGVVSIDGTSHYDFADLPLLSPLAPQLGLKGPINGKRVTTIINDYLLSFFNMTLKGQTTTLFEDQFQKYMEVKFTEYRINN